MHGTDLEQEVIEVNSRNDDTEDSDTHANALRIEVIVQQGRGIERVAVVLQLVTNYRLISPFGEQSIKGSFPAAFVVSYTPNHPKCTQK